MGCGVMQGGVIAGCVFEERSQDMGDGGDWKVKMCGRINALGGGICWVAAAWYVSGDDSTLGSVQDGVDALECVICGFVSTLAIPPPLNDTSIVSKNFEMNIGGTRRDDVSDEKFASDAFCPTDVLTICIPAWS